jgi:hypothetical protein
MLPPGDHEGFWQEREKEGIRRRGVELIKGKNGFMEKSEAEGCSYGPTFWTCGKVTSKPEKVNVGYDILTLLGCTSVTVAVQSVMVAASPSM